MDSGRSVLSFTFFIILVSSIKLCTSENVSPEQLPSICKSDCKVPMDGSETEKYCKKCDLNLQDRCCLNASTVVGVDLRGCNMTRETFASGIKTFCKLAIISIEQNPITEIKKSDFTNNTNILYLSLPPEIKQCPGGNRTWEIAKNDIDVTLCENELNPCDVYNITCPDYSHSHCVHSGVNLTKCLCDAGYYGYKCLKEGQFPYMEFGIALCVPTCIICIFLWVTQRRYVKPKPKST